MSSKKKFTAQRANEVSERRNRDVETKEVRNNSGLENLVFSFEYFDNNQIPPGQSFQDWDDEGILASLLNRLMHLSKMNKITAQQGKRSPLEIYGKFPNNSDFHVPQFSIPQNAEWGTIRYVGHQIRRVAGFIVDNVFYIVFLDKNHKFYIMN